jgi:lipid-binding SYLF domain-containing protein
MKEEKTRVYMASIILLVCLGLLGACTTAPLTISQKEDKQIDVLTMANETMDRFYQANRGARDQVTLAAGFAVFSDTGFKLGIMGGSKGAGMAVNNISQKETFMKMFEIQPGLGIGAEKFWLLLIFDTSEAFNNFVSSGWEFGANAMAAAKSVDKGGALAGAVTLADGVHMLQLTEKGLIIGVSITAVRFYPDKDLN